MKLRAIDSEDTFSIDEYVLAFIHPKQTSEVPIQTIRRVMDRKGIKGIDPEVGADKIYEELAESRRVLGRIADSTYTPPSPGSPELSKIRSPILSPSDAGHAVSSISRRLTKVRNIVEPSRSRSVSRSRSRSPSVQSLKDAETPLPTATKPEKSYSIDSPNPLAASQDSFLDVAGDDYSEPINESDLQPQLDDNRTSSSNTALLPSFSFRRSPSSKNRSDSPSEKKKGVRGTVNRFSDMFVSSFKHYLPPTAGEYAGVNDPEKYQVSEDEKIESNKRFQLHFGFGEEEQLVATYYAHIEKPIPIYGKIYVSANFVCFRSLLIGTKPR